MKIEREKTMCTGVGVASVKTALDFDSEMSSVKVIAGATDDEFEKLYKQAIQLGAETVLSASEAAADMASFARAGYNAKEIMAGIPCGICSCESFLQYQIQRHLHDLANLKSALIDVQEVTLK